MVIYADDPATLKQATPYGMPCEALKMMGGAAYERMDKVKLELLNCGHKFIVIKRDDLRRINSFFKLAMLDNDLKDIQTSREAEGKDPCPKYLVVNVDEPYAGQVADLIEVEERRKGTWDHGEKTLREVMGIV